MNTHLNESSLAEFILGTVSPEIRRHTEACSRCRDEANRLRNAILCGRESIRAQAARDEIFWTKQFRTIRERTAALDSVRLFPRIAVAALAMLLVLVSALLLVHRQRSVHTAINEPPQQMSNDVADDALLQQVQTDIARDYPIALEPAVLISQERNSAVSAVTASAPIHSDEKEQQP
jgi:hypothetical protein